MTRRDVSVLVFAHRDRYALNATARSVQRAVDVATQRGWSATVSLIARDPNPQVTEWIEEHAPKTWRTRVLPDAALGPARRDAIAEAAGDFIAIVDAGDLWSRSWLADALDAADTETSSDSVWRPSMVFLTTIDFLTGRFRHTYIQPDMTSSDLAAGDLLAAAPFTSTFVSRRRILDQVPFPIEDVARGWTHVDWWWSVSSAVAGHRHRLVPDSVHYRLLGLDGVPLATVGQPTVGRVGPTGLGRRHMAGA